MCEWYGLVFTWSIPTQYNVATENFFSRTRDFVLFLCQNTRSLRTLKKRKNLSVLLRYVRQLYSLEASLFSGIFAITKLPTNWSTLPKLLMILMSISSSMCFNCTLLNACNFANNGVGTVLKIISHSRQGWSQRYGDYSGFRKVRIGQQREH